MRDQFDARLTAAFRDVPVPTGLDERLLARLVAEQSPAPSLRFSRRWWLVAGSLATAAAASLLVAVWLGLEGRPPISAEYAVGEAIQSFASGVERPGYSVAERPAPSEYPLSQWVLAIRGTTWQPLEGFLGRRGVVYHLPGPAGASAALYVVEQDNVGDIGTEPEQHPFTTAGCCASAWREGGLLYVLVVQGDRATYGRYLNLPRSPLA